MPISKSQQLSIWEAIGEEYEFLTGEPLGQGFSARVETFNRECEVLKQSPIPAKSPRAGDASEAERDLASYVCGRMRSRGFNALCFSGGGIRSGTLCLGILQALAERSDTNPQTGRLSLLGEIDYLSTVSGGGYIGSWFTSWVHRAKGGLDEVVKELSTRPEHKTNPEPEPVRHLRQYSNYLNPHLGVGSADTWTLGATVIRNILLNWLVLLPCIAALLMVPRLLLVLVHYGFGQLMEPVPAAEGLTAGCLALMASASILGVPAAVYAALSLPAVGLQNKRQAWFLAGVLAPQLMASILLSLAFACARSAQGVPWPHWQYAAVPPALLLVAALVSFIAVAFNKKRYGHRLRWGWMVTATIFLLIAGALGGELIRVTAGLLPPKWEQDVVAERWFVVLSVPVLQFILFLAQTLLVGLASKLTKDEDREWLARYGAWTLVVMVVWILAAGVSLFGPAELQFLYSIVAAALGGILGRLGFGASTKAKKPSKDVRESKAAKYKELAIKLLLPGFVLFLLLALSALNENLVQKFSQWFSIFPTPIERMQVETQSPFVKQESVPPGRWEMEVAVLALDVAVCFLAALFVNVNKFSLHGMYKSRLIRAYLGASRKKADRTPNLFTGFDPHDNLLLKDLRQRPLHVVNMALNLVAGSELAWQERKAASFTASPLHAGSLWWGYRPIKQYSDPANGMTLGGAVTISGAAASPNMGYHSSPLLTIVMTLFNARLGCWLGNPGNGGDKTWRRDGPTWGLRSFLDEMFGWTNEGNKWAYLSDGGHFENLGLYEMVLRRCRHIIVADGSCDNEYAFEDLANAMRKIRIDLGIPIEFPDGLRIGEDHRGHLHFAVAQIKYSAIDGNPEEENGWLLYFKSSLTGKEPPEITQYKKLNPDFPHETTADQWFSESQFESYRALGYFIACEALGQKRYSTIEELFNHVRDAAEEGGPD
jgi:hypothetical protein